MGQIVTIPQTIRFGVMYTESKRIVSIDGYIYGFGEAPEETYSLDVAQALYARMISEGHTDKTITLFMYSPDTINEDRQPFPVDEEYYSRDRLFSACYPEFSDYTLTSEFH